MTSTDRKLQPAGKAFGARWLTAISLAVVAAFLLAELAWPARADDDAGTASGGSLLAVAGKVNRDCYGLFLVNTRTGTVCVYEWQPAERKLRLMAARNCAFDMRLDEYNTEPAPREIKKLLDESQRLPGAEGAP
jgi:hypothetical protein